jgi:hypothetical protein
MRLSGLFTKFLITIALFFVCSMPRIWPHTRNKNEFPADNFHKYDKHTLQKHVTQELSSTCKHETKHYFQSHYEGVRPKRVCVGGGGGEGPIVRTTGGSGRLFLRSAKRHFIYFR